MSLPYKCILFDVDGVITSSIDHLTVLTRELAEELGALKTFPDRFYRENIGVDYATWLLPIIPQQNHHKVNKVAAAKSIIADDPSRTPLIKGAKVTLVRIHDLGKQIGFISTKPRKAMDAFIDFNNLHRLVDYSICGDEVTHYKPNPEGINKALSNLNLSNTDAVFIGDSLHDLGAAQNANMAFIGVLTGIAAKNDWESKGTRYVNSINDLLLG